MGFSRLVRFDGAAAILVCKSKHDLGRVSKLPIRGEREWGLVPLPLPSVGERRRENAEGRMGQHLVFILDIQWVTDFSNLLEKLNWVREIGGKNRTEAHPRKRFLFRKIAASLKKIEGSDNGDSTGGFHLTRPQSSLLLGNPEREE